MVHRLLHPVAPVAAVLVAAVAVAFPGAPASAAGCPTADGVTVVVDFHQLDGGVQTACVADGGGETAAQLFPAAGFPLTYVQRQPSFVCRVSGKPADNPCVNTPPADAYWALYWSDGRSGRWTYATSGAGGQHVPDGGYVAFSWQGSSDSAAPGASPAPHPSASPTPTRAPTHTAAPGHTGPSSAPPSATSPATSSATSSAATAGPSGSPSATSSRTKAGDGPHSREPQPSGSSATTAGDSPTASDSPSLLPASADPADPGGGGLPGWVAPVVIVLLFGAAGAVAVVRRRGAA
ncbi:hypothetical protein [Nocardioides sp. URHA0032]|uniref:hypothetical protein n=1 Tax=Nocardioides sp. URHA0032 TaxID=1380388 RepID=UPI00049006C3|nr:hypothetical protein [Nocardioides sp. URHA0032]